MRWGFKKEWLIGRLNRQNARKSPKNGLSYYIFRHLNAIFTPENRFSKNFALFAVLNRQKFTVLDKVEIVCTIDFRL